MKTKPSQLSVIDLFSGCGGLSLGMQNAGFEVIAGFDNWELAIEVYRCNFAHQAFVVDLSSFKNKLELFKEFKPDIIAGGPPCQDFSSAGKRDESLGRGDLTISFAEIVAAIQPQFFIMENVDRFVKSPKYQQAKSIFKEAKYGLSKKILNASFCGVPQSRKRFFWVGEFKGEDNKLDTYLDANLSTEAMTIRQYFREIGASLNIEHYYRHPRSYKRRGVFSIDEPSPTVRGVNRPIPKTYKPHSGDSAPISSAIRPLTTLERSYLQTFPKNYSFSGSKTDIEQMIGNAVPVKLAEYVAQCLAQYVADGNQSFVNLGDSKALPPRAAHVAQVSQKFVQLSLF